MSSSQPFVIQVPREYPYAIGISLTLFGSANYLFKYLLKRRSEVYG